MHTNPLAFALNEEDYPVALGLRDEIQATISHIEPATQTETTNTDAADVPEEIKGWNWGAFAFNWIWGIGNKTYLPLLALIPIFDIVWIFICGAKGNEWAWKDGHYTDVESFKNTQATWNRAGLVMFIIQVVLIALYILLLGMIFTFFSHMEF